MPASSMLRCEGSWQKHEQVIPAACACIALRYPGQRQWPVNRKVRVVVGDRQILGRIMSPIDSVADIGGFGEGLKAMQEAGRNVQVPEGIVIEQESLLPAERRGISPNVNQHIVDRAMRTAHQLGLAAARASVHTTDHSFGGARLRILHERGGQPRRAHVVVEDVRVERSGEQSSIVGERLWDENENVCKLGLFDTHQDMLP